MVSSIKLEFEPLTLTTKHPFGISYGTSKKTHNILVKLTYQGLVGLGECAPAPYHNETIETVTACLKLWQQSDFLGSDPFAVADVIARLDKSVAGNAAAKAGIEIALHDLQGKIVDKPINALFGLSGLATPMTDFTIALDSLDVIEAKTKEAVEAGYKILKVKQGTAQGLDYDKEIIKRVRKAAPTIPIRVDANGGWTVKQAINMSHFLAENGVQFIEQPLAKFALAEDFRLVREQSALPIFADESVCQSRDVARLAGCVDGVVVKLAKTGGLLEALKVIHTARAHDMQVMFGGMIESSVGVTAACHLQALCDHLDLDGALLCADDPFEGAIYEDGYLKLSDRPGLGVVAR
jgi:L-alanine-DL-glutamate epimerase-like enolase superfamily enzyme